MASAGMVLGGTQLHSCQQPVRRPVRAQSHRLCSRPLSLGTPLGRPGFLAGTPLQHRAANRQQAAFKQDRRACRVAAQQAGAAAVTGPLGPERELDGLQKQLAGLSTTAVYAVSAVLVGGAAAAGLLAGGMAPVNVRKVAQAAGAIAGGAAAAAVAQQLQVKRRDAAGIELYNLVAQRSDPGSLRREEVEALGAKYGINVSQQLVNELKGLYDVFLEAIIPPGATPLRGDEWERIRAFKEALGLSDEDAAPVHLDVGRRLSRSRFEAGSRTADVEQRKAFSKLVYVSNLVFGDQKAAFMLPWRRTFSMTDAQLALSKAENAKMLYKAQIDANNGELVADRAWLAELRAVQERVRCPDEDAQEVVAAALRGRVEHGLDRAVGVLKARTRVRDYSPAVREVRELLAYSRAMAALAGEEGLPRGLGPVTVYGGAWAEPGKSRDLRDLFRVYVEESLKEAGAFSDQLEDDVTELGRMLALGTREATSTVQEISSKIYRQLLREEFTSGRLDSAPSKAAVLQDLCERLKFDSEAASALHKSLYRQKLDQVLEKKKVTDDDATELDRLRRLLCISKKDVRELERETKGRIYQAAVEEAMALGIDRFGFDARDEVVETRKNLRLDADLAKELLASVARRAFLGFTSRARNQANRLEAAKELKKLVFFSNIVVSPLLEDLKSDEQKKKEAEEADKAKQQEDAKKELAELMAKAKEAADREERGEAAEGEAESAEAEAEAKAKDATVDAEVVESKEEASSEDAAKESPTEEGADADSQPTSLKKSREAAAARAAGEEVGSSGVTMKSQKEITLRDDLELRDRLDVYRNFLLYCMSGDVVALPMGTTVVVERDESEFARLSQLGDVLGLTMADVATVHQGLAEQAFRQQVQQAMGGDSALTKEKADSLEEVRQKMGLPKEAANKIIKGFQNQRLISGLQAAKAQGTLNLQKVLDLKEAGVDVDSIASKELRLNLYRDEVKAQLSNGRGDYDGEKWNVQLPADLGLDQKQAQRAVEELAKGRRRDTLVQAVSALRQRKLDDSKTALNNLLSCTAALGAGQPVSWQPREELQDLYSVYIGREKDAEKQAAVAKTLGLSESEASGLADIVASGQFKLEQEVEEEAFF